MEKQFQGTKFPLAGMRYLHSVQVKDIAIGDAEEH
jgi:hypothetical protein